MLTPGSAMDMEGYLRIGYGNETAVLREGLERFSAFLAAHGLTRPGDVPARHAVGARHHGASPARRHLVAAPLPEPRRHGERHEDAPQQPGSQHHGVDRQVRSATGKRTLEGVDRAGQRHERAKRGQGSGRRRTR